MGQGAKTMRFWTLGMKEVKISETKLGKEYTDFLRDYGFSLVNCTESKSDRIPYIVELFQNEDLMLASSVHPGDGWLVFVAPLGAATDPDIIIDRGGGWSLISEVWIDYFSRYAQAQDKRPYPHEVPEAEKRQIFDETFRQFMDMIRGGELAVARPTHRIEDDLGEDVGN